jgi:ribonucleoside-diphosphate reductase alpha chain
VRDGDTKKELERKVHLASVLGTVQSTLTNFKYLRKIWRDNCNEERLLGVSLTGQFGHSVLSGSDGLDKLGVWLDGLRLQAIRTNAEYAETFGVSASTAITTVKPSGTVSQLTASSSGMHPWYSDYYFRTVRADNKDPMTQFMKDFGIPNEPDVMAPDTTTIFTFPQAAPKTAVKRNDLAAREHLEIWKVYKTHWTEHNPSVTINVDEGEWIDVANWVYDNWEFIGGISFLPKDNGNYQQAPYQDAVESDYKQFMAEMPKEMDWQWLSDYEHEDTTTGSQTLACTANNCEVVSIGSEADEVSEPVLKFASI